MGHLTTYDLALMIFDLMRLKLFFFFFLITRIEIVTRFIESDNITTTFVV